MMTVMRQKPFYDYILTEVHHAMMTVLPQKPLLERYTHECRMP